MFDRIANSWQLAKSSWHVLVTDKKLLLFPFFSGVGALLVIISFFVPIAVIAVATGGLGVVSAPTQDGEGQLAWWVYPTLFAFYYCNYFVVIFFNSALVSCALMRFNGEQPTLGDGFRAAWARLPQIALWALVAATVGILLKMIESNRRVGRFVAAILGTAWTVITYFVVPVIVVEKANPFSAIGRSLSILRKTWGEALVGNIGLGFFKFLLALPLIALIAIAIFCLMGAQSTPALVWVAVALFVLAGLYLVVFLAVSSALGTIFQSALYQYAAFDSVPRGFDRYVMEEAFVSRR